MHAVDLLRLDAYGTYPSLLDLPYLLKATILLMCVWFDRGPSDASSRGLAKAAPFHPFVDDTECTQRVLG
jgi:hypothetical protein